MESHCRTVGTRGVILDVDNRNTALLMSVEGELPARRFPIRFFTETFADLYELSPRGRQPLLHHDVNPHVFGSRFCVYLFIIYR